MAKFRPPQQFLDVFWTLSDGNDDERSAGAVYLTRLIKNSEENDKKQIVCYCRERLIKGLSSGRKFARVGFSVALVQLLRHSEGKDVSEVLSVVKEKLTIAVHEKKLKSEIGGIYLGQAFAISALIQAGKVRQLSSDVLLSLVEELLHMTDKRSYLKPVCFRVIQDLVGQVSADVFRSHIWPKIKVSMKQAWELCTIDKIALLIFCRDIFPEVVKKKFLRKYWGFPVLSEANDSKLLAVVMTSLQRSEVLLEQIIPHLLKSGRDIISVWRAFGEKLVERQLEKRPETVAHKQLLGLKIASTLIDCATNSDQILDIVLSPGLARCVFHSDLKRNDPVVTAANSLCKQITRSIMSGKIHAVTILESLWKLEASLSQKESSGKFELVKSNNFAQIIDLMSKTDAESYSKLLMDFVLGHDKWQVISNDPAKKQKQTEWCLRQLQHLCSPQLHTSTQTQFSILALFLRLAFFSVKKTVPCIEHCETPSDRNLLEGNELRMLTEVFFFRELDSLFTSSIGQRKKWEHLSQYLDMLLKLAEYVKDLLQTENVVPITTTPSQMTETWQQLLSFCKTIIQNPGSPKQELKSAFALLVLFLGFYMLTHFQLAMDLLQDVYVCYGKATGTAERDLLHVENEPEWIEVIMDVLLKLMSIHSHLGRIVAACVFHMLSAYITPKAVSLIIEILIPGKSYENDGEGEFLEDDDENIDDDGNDSVTAENMSVSDEVNEDEEGTSNVGKDETLSTDSDGRESMSDLSDSDMFKLDDALAEVFRHRQKSSGKKAREEKKQEMINFQVRILDFVEILIKGERCGDFIYDLLKPVVKLTLRSTSSANQVVSERAKTFLSVIKSKVKGLVDNIHSAEDQKDLFLDLLDLARKATDAKCLHQLSVACYIVTAVRLRESEKQCQLRACAGLVMNALEELVSKKHSKLPVIFFKKLIELDPIQFQELGPEIVHRLKDDSLKPHSQMIFCSILASLCKKTDNVEETDLLTLKRWMRDAAQVVTQLILSLDKVMFYKDILTLGVTLLTRIDVLPDVSFGVDVREHLIKIKSKFNTDLRRLANKIISTTDKQICSGPVRKRKMSCAGPSPAPSCKKFAAQTSSFSVS